MFIKKFAIRFILFGKSRTYVVQDEHSVDAIIQALDRLECDVPGMVDAAGLCLICKAYPEGAALADEGEGPIIDTTRVRLVSVAQTEPEALEAA